MFAYLLSSFSTEITSFISLVIVIGIPFVSPIIINNFNNFVISPSIKVVSKLADRIFTKPKKILKLCSIFSQTVCSYAYLRMVQYLNNSVKQIDKNLFEVQYILKGKLYKMIIKPHKGPCPVLQIVNENLDDVTDLILPYFGPSYNWRHAQEIDLAYFKAKSLTFEFSDGSFKRNL